LKNLTRCPECDFPLNELISDKQLGNYRGWCSRCSLLWCLPSNLINVKLVSTIQLTLRNKIILKIRVRDLLKFMGLNVK
jgi:hypothetical protein